MASSFVDAQENGGNLWVYLEPEDWTSRPWDKIDIASGFIANDYQENNSGNRQTPGYHTTFYPSE